MAAEVLQTLPESDDPQKAQDRRLPFGVDSLVQLPIEITMDGPIGSIYGTVTDSNDRVGDRD